MKEVTLKDIADDSGYSISTVSRVLNNSGKISHYAKEKICKSAKKLNYPINRRIKSSLNNHFFKIALVISDFREGEFYSSFYQGFTRAAGARNVLLSVVSIAQFNSTLDKVIKNLHQANDGLILHTPAFDRNDYLKLQQNLPAAFPVVSTSLIENPVFTTITFDNYRGGHLAAQYFHQHTYSTCGIIKGPQHKTEARYRHNGFKDYIAPNDNMKLVWEYNGNYRFDAGTSAFEEFHQLKEKPRAIFASNDAMCHGFLEAATKNGYNFPEDVAIIGFHDLPICRHHQPTISSISTSYHQLGQAALGTVQRMISDTDSQEGMLSFLPVSLAERKSS